MRESSPLPSGIRLPPSPKGDGFFSGSCFAVAGVGALVVGQSRIEREFPLPSPVGATSDVQPVPLGDPRGTAFGLCFLGCWRIIDIKKAPTPLCGCLLG